MREVLSKEQKAARERSLIQVVTTTKEAGTKESNKVMAPCTGLS